MDLTEAKDIKKRWKEYTEELYKKDLHDPDNHDGVITDLEPDILECEVKWALESITMNKTSGVHGISVELFQFSLSNNSLMRYQAYKLPPDKKSGKNTQKDCPKKIFTTQIIMMV